MDQRKGNKAKRKEGRRVPWHPKLLPLQAVLAVLPFITFHYMASSGFGAYPWNSVEDTFHDFFLYWKMVVFVILAAVMLVLTALKIRKQTAQERKAFFLRLSPAFVYLLLALLSTVFSADLRYSIFGSMDAYEPFPVLLGYVVVLCYAYLVVERREDVIWLLRAALLGAVLVSVVGVLQAFGIDIFMMERVQNLLLEKGLKDSGIAFSAVFPQKMVYATLFNPNYVGTYSVLYLPVVAAAAIMDKNLWVRLACLPTSAGLLIMLFFSRSRTGTLALVAVLFVALVLLVRHSVRRWYLAVAVLLFVFGIFFAADRALGSLLTNRLRAMMDVTKQERQFLGFDTTGKQVKVVFADKLVTVEMLVSGNDFAYVVAEDGKTLEVTYRDEKRYADAVLSDGSTFTVQTALYEEQYAFGLTVQGRTYYFTNQDDPGNYQYINEYGRADECVVAETALPGYERVASGRAYIWGRSLTLFRRYALLGSGPDTFVLAFPQNDYVAKNATGVIYTRPHNLYLQIGVETGVLSLAALLVLWLWYLGECCVLYFAKGGLKGNGWFGCAVSLSAIGFFVAGLANDSLIVVSPVFWTLLGSGMAVNTRLRLERKADRQSAGARKQGIKEDRRRAKEERENAKVKRQEAEHVAG